MYIHKCDLCKKVIKERGQMVRAEYGNDSVDLCEQCGKPVMEFLAEHEVIGGTRKRLEAIIHGGAVKKKR